MVSIFEGLMLACFGFSWPINMVKSYRSRTAKGKSLFFETLILAGYIFGIIGKFQSGAFNWVFILYFVNLTFVAIDFALTLRNKKLDKLSEK